MLLNKHIDIVIFESRCKKTGMVAQAERVPFKNKNTKSNFLLIKTSLFICPQKNSFFSNQKNQHQIITT